MKKVLSVIFGIMFVITLTTCDDGGSSSSGSNFSSGGSNSSSYTWVTCSSCKGGGRDPVPKYPPNYGGNPAKEKCAQGVCSGLDYPHSHNPCYSCNGLGRIKVY